MNIAQMLPPKMTEQYAARARNGDWHYKMQSSGQTDEHGITARLTSFDEIRDWE